MSVAILDSLTAAAVAAATTQEAQRTSILAPFGAGDVIVRHMAGATIAEVSTHGAWVLNGSSPLGASLGPLSATTVNVSGATITSRVFVAGSTQIFSLFAADLTMSAAETLTGRRQNLSDAIQPKMIVRASSALPLATTYLATFSVDDTGRVGTDMAGVVINTGTGSFAWSIEAPTNTTVTPSSGTLAGGATQALVIAASAADAYSLTLVSSGTTITGNSQALVVSPALATTLTLSLPNTGTATVAVDVTVTPNGPVSGGGTATLATTAGTLGTDTLTWTDGESAAKTTTLTLASAGSASVTLTTGMSLSIAGSPATFNAAASPGYFSSVVLDTTDGVVPSGAAGQTVIVELHGSGTAYSFYGDKWNANLAGGLEYSTDTVFKFAIAIGSASNGNAVTMVRPWDRQGTFPVSGLRRESYWIGWTDGPEAELNLYTERRLDAMVAWVKANQPNLSATKWALTGGSMGAWGTLTYGIRRPHLFAGLWPDRPRWRNAEVINTVRVPSWTQPPTPGYPVSASPAVRTEDGGGTSAAHLDITTYISNPANPIPWIGWHIGKLDGYMPWQDHVDAINALRATGRGFAVYWNNDGHSISSAREAEIRSTYPLGLFEIGKGYPVFSEHSLDNDPTADLVGGINVGLNFRNVVETSSTWQCDVRYQGTASRPQQACTVKVKPKSTIYTGTPAAQLVSLPAAGGWVTVTF